MTDTWTIRRVLEWTAQDFKGRGIESGRLDAELLAAEALGIERVGLYLDMDRPLMKQELSDIRALIARRREREPVAYILGRRDFYGRRFSVDASVLIPRPDTETLVERGIEILRSREDARLLDVCTGSGAIGISIALGTPGAPRSDSVSTTLSDISEAALVVATRNVEALCGEGADVTLLHSDLFERVEGDYDLITANPPYVTTDELRGLSPDIRDHEPSLALDAGTDGFVVIDRLVREAKDYLRPGGAMLIEVGEGQAGGTMARLEEAGFVRATAIRDLGGVDRVVEAWKP